MALLTPKEWTEYWDVGEITTFAAGFNQGYDGSFLEFWAEQIDSEHTPIVDLCCGNGALVWLAHQVVKEKSINAEITGVDIAEIKPFRKLKKEKHRYRGVAFIGNTSIESLPFTDSSIGLAVSQYGLEYSCFEKSIPELMRVLKPKARIAFIMHSERSEILEKMSFFYETFSYYFEEGNLADKFRAIDEVYSASGTLEQVKESAVYRKLTGEINRLIYPVTNRHMDTFTPLVSTLETGLVNLYIDHLFRIFHNRGTRNLVRRKDLEIQIQKIQTTLNRVDDLKSSAVSEERYQKLITTLEGHNFVIKDSGNILYGTPPQQNMGWKLVAERG